MALSALLLGPILPASAAVSVSFSTLKPDASGIFASYEPVSQDALGWVRLDDSPGEDVIRTFGQSFLVPAEANYLMTGLTMQLFAPVAEDFAAPSEFTLVILKLNNPGDSPISGQVVDEQTGFVQATTATAPGGSYLTMTLDEAISLEAGGVYAYFLGFNQTTTYNRFLFTISSSAPDPFGTRVSQPNMGVVHNETALYYIHGEIDPAAVPEPGSVMLGAIALGTITLMARRRKLSLR